MNKNLIIWGGILVAAAIFFQFSNKLNTTRLSSNQQAMPYEDAVGELSKLLKTVNWGTNYVQRRAQVELGAKPDLKETLPSIDQYPITVEPGVSNQDVVAEIFVTTVRGWSPVVKGRTRTADGRMVEVARAFNESNQKLSGGKGAKVRVRFIASGTGYQFIASEKYMPDAFTPVHHLWIEMLKEHGIPTTMIRENMVTSAGGIVMKNEVAERLRSTYGELDVKSIINEVVQGNLAMGYTNPFASSTGLNFLMTTLSTFAEGDEQAMLSSAVVDTFQKFQQSVPFVALTTLQMREAVRNDGSLDAFVMGHQTFLGTDSLQNGYEFIPFGVKHDHPLYAVGDPGAEKLEVLELLATFAEKPEYKQLAKDYGWDQAITSSFTPNIPIPSGKTLIEAQQLWKEKKDAGRKIAAVFLSDVSGSMGGSRMAGVKKALMAGSKFITADNSIGLVLFSDQVEVVLPVKKFNLNHRASFVAAVQDMNSGGGTSMYDGVAVALKLLTEEKEKDPSIKPMLFVLTDGETASGLSFTDLSPVIKGIKIPVYTIGYEANVGELKRLSVLVEAASISAGEGNVEYKIGSLLNAQM